MEVPPEAAPPWEGLDCLSKTASLSREKGSGATVKVLIEVVQLENHLEVVAESDELKERRE
jgi:hypothetical protein